MLRVIILFLIILLVISSCAVQQATINTYIDPAYHAGTYQSLAVFPIQNASFAPSEARQINRNLTSAIHLRNPKIKILGSAEASRILNEHGLADDWALFLDNYYVSGVPDAQALKVIGEALEVGAIIQGEIVNLFQQDGAYGRNKGATRVTVRYSMIDVHKGEVVWESSSDGLVKTATKLENAPPIIKAVNLAVNKILLSLPSF